MATLETTSKRNDEDRIELTVIISADEVQKHINTAYKEAGKVRIPGFRPGKAPRRVLENHYGGKGYFQAQATDELVKGSLPLAIDAEGYVPLDKPEVAEFDLVEEGEGYSYTMSFTVSPTLELSSYESVQIELPSEEPTPEEIDQQVDVMLGYYVDFEDVTDRPVGDGDCLTLQMETLRDGERVDGLSGDSIPYQLGLGTMPASFDEHLLSMNIDETREFDLTLSSDENEGDEDADDESPSDDDKPMHVVVTVKEVKVKVKPELTDAWVKEKIEFSSVDEFKNRIAESIRTQKQTELVSLKERLIVEELASRLDGEPTDLLVTQTEQGIYRDFFTSLQRRNQTLDVFLTNAGITFDAFREDIKKQAVGVAAQALALDALARHLELEITEEEIRAEFESSGAEDPDELYQQWEENGRLSEIREGLLRMKATRHLNENVEVFEPGKKPTAAKGAKKTKQSKAATAKSEKETAVTEESATETSSSKKPAVEASATDKSAAKKSAAKKPAKATEQEPEHEKAATKRKPVAKKTDNKS
jgi:trigger factor